MADPALTQKRRFNSMLAGFLLGIVHDRKLMREAHVNVAIRWFAGFGLANRLPDHSSLTRIRQRWGEARFRRIFEKTVTACLVAKIAKGEIVHIDATLIRADVSWESLAGRWVAKVGEANSQPEEAERIGRQSGKYKKVCVTDPDATMATNGRNRRLEPAYKQHTAVDDEAGVVLDVTVTTGQVNEGGTLDAQIDTVQRTTGVAVQAVTADAGYAYAKVYGRTRGTPDRGDHPAQGRADQEPGADAPLPIRCQARYPKVSARQDTEGRAGGEARPLLHLASQGLQTL